MQKEQFRIKKSEKILVELKDVNQRKKYLKRYNIRAFTDFNIKFIQHGYQIKLHKFLSSIWKYKNTKTKTQILFQIKVNEQNQNL